MNDWLTNEGDTDLSPIQKNSNNLCIFLKRWNITSHALNVDHTVTSFQRGQYRKVEGKRVTLQWKNLTNATSAGWLRLTSTLTWCDENNTLPLWSCSQNTYLWKTPDKFHLRGTLPHAWAILLKDAKVIKHKESLRHGHSQEEPRDMTKCNLGSWNREKTSGENWINLNKV